MNSSNMIYVDICVVVMIIVECKDKVMSIKIKVESIWMMMMSRRVIIIVVMKGIIRIVCIRKIILIRLILLRVKRM